MSKKYNRGLSLGNILLFGLAIILCLGLMANLSFGGGFSSGNTPSTIVPGETLTPGTRLPLTVNLNGVQILGPDGAAAETPKYVEVGSFLEITFTAAEGFSYDASWGMKGLKWSNVTVALCNNLDDTFTLILSDFTGPVSVSITGESVAPPSSSYNFELVYNSKDLFLLSQRPVSVTQGDEVILEFTKSVSNAVYGYVTVINCKYEITSSSGDILEIKVYDFVGDAKVTVGSKLQYGISYSLAGCSADPANTEVVYSTGSVELKFAADEGYTLPENITVLNANYVWLPDIGTLKLSNVTANVIITISALEGEPDIPYVKSYFISSTHNKSRTIPAFDNPTVIEEGQTVCLTYTKANEYVQFGYISVTGADYLTEIDGDTLTITISNPVDNVAVTVGNKVVYPIEYALNGCDSAVGSPVSVTAGAEYTLQFYAMVDNYVFPEEISVSNADYLWDSSTGKLRLENARGPVKITIDCIPFARSTISFYDRTSGYYLGYDVLARSGDTEVSGYIGCRDEFNEGLCVLELPFSGLWTIECSEMSFEVDVPPAGSLTVYFDIEESDDGPEEIFTIS